MDRKTRTSSIARYSRGLTAGLAVVVVLAAASAATGALAAERKLAFAVGGVVEKVMVKPGQRVSAGQPLAALDPAPLAARKKAAEAGLKAAQLVHIQAAENFERIRQLYDDLSTSREELEKAEKHLAEAAAHLEKSKARSVIAAWRLERATLRAPGAGVVKSVPGYPGLVVHPRAGFTPVVVLQ